MATLDLMLFVEYNQYNYCTMEKSICLLPINWYRYEYIKTTLI